MLPKCVLSFFFFVESSIQDIDIEFSNMCRLNVIDYLSLNQIKIITFLSLDYSNYYVCRLHRLNNVLQLFIKNKEIIIKKKSVIKLINQSFHLARCSTA